MSEDGGVSLTICEERMKHVEERINEVKAVTNEIHKLTLAVERLTITVQNMVSEQASHEKRLDAIEQKDGDMWRSVVKYVITGIVGVAIGYAMKHLGF